MDWRRNTDFDQCACWFDHRSILDYGECKEPRTTSIEPPVAKRALKSPGRCAWGSIFRSISSGSLAMFAAISRAQSDLILIKLRIEPLWFKSRLYMGAPPCLGA